MGSSNSKTPQEIYEHVALASTALFLSVGKSWRSDSDAKLIRFFAEFKYAVDKGEIDFPKHLHPPEAGDFTHSILRRCKDAPGLYGADKMMFECYDKFLELERDMKPDVLRAHVMALWMQLDLEHLGSLPLGVIQENLINQLDMEHHFKRYVSRRLQELERPYAGTGTKHKRVGSSEKIGFAIVSDVFEHLSHWKELDVFWKANFESAQEAMTRGNFLTPYELAKFLRVYQHEGNSAASARATPICNAFGGVMDRYAFLRFLADPALNPVVDTAKESTVYHDMESFPLSSYFISSSFRTYIALPEHFDAEKGAQTHQLETMERRGAAVAHAAVGAARCSLGRYKEVLLAGARAVEVDVWDRAQQYGNANAKSSSSNASTPSSQTPRNASSSSASFPFSALLDGLVVGPDPNCATNLPLDAVLHTIAENAFTQSPFPVIVLLNTFVSEEKQQKIAQALPIALGGLDKIFCKKTGFGDATKKTKATVEPHEWSPAALKGKFLLCGRVGGVGSSPTTAEPVSVAAAGTTHTAAARINPHHWTGAAIELAELCFVQQLQTTSVADLLNSGTGADPHAQQRRDLGIARNVSNDPTACVAMRSLSDDGAAAFSVTHVKTVAAAATAGGLLRIFPAGPKWAVHRNFFPATPWECGVQLLSMMWEHGNDEALRLYRHRFGDNGGCGYLLRPPALLAPRLAPELLPAGVTGAAPRLQKFNFTVLSAFCLPHPAAKLYDGETCNPFCVVRVEGPGHPPNRMALKTKVLPDAGFHANWWLSLTEEERKKEVQRKMRESAHLDMEPSEEEKRRAEQDKQMLEDHDTVTTHCTHAYHGETTGGSHHDIIHDFPAHCSATVEVLIPEMTTLVVQVFHSRRAIADRMHDPSRAESLQAGYDDRHTHLDEQQQEAQGLLKDLLLAECYLPVHLLHRGIRCLRLQCVEPTAVDRESATMMVKVSPSVDAVEGADDEENDALAQEFSL